MIKNTKIIIGIIVAIIVAGIIMVAIKGFSYGIDYGTTTEIKVYLGGDVNISEIEEICKESFNNKKFTIRKLDYFNDSIGVWIKDATDEETTAFVNNINNKYGTSTTKDDLVSLTNGQITMKQIIKPYVAPTLIAFVLILVYMAIKYRKIGLIKSVVQPGIIIIVAELLYFSILALARIPINIYTMPIALLIFLVTVVSTTYNLEKGNA